MVDYVEVLGKVSRKDVCKIYLFFIWLIKEFNVNFFIIFVKWDVKEGRMEVYILYYKIV